MSSPTTATTALDTFFTKADRHIGGGAPVFDVNGVLQPGPLVREIVLEILLDSGGDSREVQRLLT